jgi:hypothetical protein
VIEAVTGVLLADLEAALDDARRTVGQEMGVDAEVDGAQVTEQPGGLGDAAGARAAAASSDSASAPSSSDPGRSSSTSSRSSSGVSDTAGRMRPAILPRPPATSRLSKARRQAGDILGW